ncbi:MULTISPECIES: hypothetical protein [unclassified Actinopolyspora]|uniref:hypothetical protein n=1 Tax=Actinopolyspora TaxID=1849 RepID=UPI0013F66FE7|nr:MULTISPECIES: hypothetical protein [unclassified Actinopolyspora]NHD17628.1 hypothetical protein [Actinopolyspora sp. BKK2]NHE76639.1 hypothetical protein [Actinopolyspora sp. BKK1]
MDEDLPTPEQRGLHQHAALEVLAEVTHQGRRGGLTPLDWTVSTTGARLLGQVPPWSRQRADVLHQWATLLDAQLLSDDGTGNRLSAVARVSGASRTVTITLTSTVDEIAALPES